MSRPFQDESRRFWNLVDVRGEDDCWEWRGAKLSPEKPYGKFRLRSAGTILAHRYAYRDRVGPVDGTNVLHRCDNPPCCNPKHLWTGTKAENNADMRAKGRGALPPAHKGDNNPAARLTADQVREARRLRRETGCTYQWLADRYGVPRSTIGMAVRGNNWVDLDVEPAAKWTEEQVRANAKKMLNARWGHLTGQ